MATDWVTLFDLDLAKSILRLDAAGLAHFVAERGPSLLERDQRLAREHVARTAAGLSLEPGALAEIERSSLRACAVNWNMFAERAGRGEDPKLRASIATAAGTLTDALYVDYWGCFAEVFTGRHLDRSCETNLVLRPDDPDGAYVYFLLVPHVDAMLSSLRAHWSEVTVMDDADLARLVEWRDRCASDPALRVAYSIDF